MDGSRKHHIELGKPDPERQILYVLLDIKQGKTNLQFKIPKNLDNNKDPKREIYGSCCSQCSLDSQDLQGVPRGFFSGERTATFILPSNLLYFYCFCGDLLARRTQTSLSITDHQEVPLSVSGRGGNWITTDLIYMGSKKDKIS